MSFSLKPLPYEFAALEPHIDALTMEIHHDRHHGTYVTNLNKALEGSPFADKPLPYLLAHLGELPEALRAPVRNNGGGHANHELFWESLSPSGGGEPSGSLAGAVERDLGGFEALKAALIKAGLGRFGSGWSWLSLGPDKKLIVGSTPNQDSPLSEGQVPILGIDVWEHAYYLKYQNKRADYLEAIFKVIDWKALGRRYEEAQG